VIVELATQMVQSAPVLDREVVAQLAAALVANGAPLALSLARVVEGVAAGTIDAGIALPPIAMACSTLCDPALGDREREAARFEIETLLPLPVRPPRVTAPDVPLASIRTRR
jgi:hypothetical protein